MDISRSHFSCLDRPLKVLEAGCGLDSFIAKELVREMDIISHGIDIDEYAVNNKFLDKVFIGDASEMPFENNSYDLVSAVWLLEHVLDHRRIIGEIYRVLKNEGMAILNFPNPTAPEAIVTKHTSTDFHILFRKKISKLHNASGHTFPTVFSYKNLQDIDDAFKDAGFSNVTILTFAETYYRFRTHFILGNISKAYCSLLDLLGLSLLKSSIVAIGIK